MAITIEEVCQLVINLVREKEEVVAVNKQLAAELQSIRKSDEIILKKAKE